MHHGEVIAGEEPVNGIEARAGPSAWDAAGSRCCPGGPAITNLRPRLRPGWLGNAIAERWTGGCRRELLDRTLIWNQNYLRQILHQYETHYNQHRPHRSLDAAAPLKPLPQPVVLEQYRVRRQTRVSGTINEYRLVA